LIFRKADLLPHQILRTDDAPVFPNIDGGVPKYLGNECRYGDVLRFAPCVSHHVAACGDLSNVEFGAVERTVKRLFGAKRKSGDVASLNFDAAVKYR
jgi:hypothetical protein